MRLIHPYLYFSVCKRLSDPNNFNNRPSTVLFLQLITEFLPGRQRRGFSHVCLKHNTKLSEQAARLATLIINVNIIPYEQ